MTAGRHGDPCSEAPSPLAHSTAAPPAISSSSSSQPQVSLGIGTWMLGAKHPTPSTWQPRIFRPTADLVLKPCPTHPSDLVCRLSDLRLSHLPHAQLDPSSCISEEVLVQQALRVLQGQQAHGFLFNKVDKRFEPDPKCYTPTLSPGSLYKLLNQIAAAGTDMWRLQRLCATIIGPGVSSYRCGTSSSTPSSTPSSRRVSSSSGHEPHQHASSNGCAGGRGNSGGVGVGGVPITPCLRAFATALQQQLQGMGYQLAQLQQGCFGLNPSSTSSRSHGHRMKLRDLLRLSVGVRERVHGLQKTLLPLLNEFGPSPAEASARLIDGLIAILQATCGLTADAGNGMQAALLHLLLASLLPLVAGLGRWLFGGREQEEEGTVLGGGLGPSFQTRSCCGEDFFIVKKGAVAVYDARFWSQAYTFSSSSSNESRRGSEMGEQGGQQQQNGEDGEAWERSSSRGGGGTSSSSSSGVACPSFLQPLAHDILTAGKSLRLLRHVQQDKDDQEVSAAVPLAGTAASSSRGNSWNRPLPAARAPTGSLHGIVAGRGSMSNSSSNRPGSGLGFRASMGPGAGGGHATAAGGAVQQRKRWGPSIGSHPSSAVGMAAVPRLDGLSETLRLRLAIAAATAGQQQEEEGLQQLFLERAVDLLELKGCCGVLDVEGKWKGLGVQELRVLYAAQAGGRGGVTSQEGGGLKVWKALQAKLVLSGSSGAQPCNMLFAAAELKQLSNAVVAAAAAAEEAAEAQAYESAIGAFKGAAAATDVAKGRTLDQGKSRSLQKQGYRDCSSSGDGASSAAGGAAGDPQQPSRGVGGAPAANGAAATAAAAAGNGAGGAGDHEAAGTGEGVQGVTGSGRFTGGGQMTERAAVAAAARIPGENVEQKSDILLQGLGGSSGAEEQNGVCMQLGNGAEEAGGTGCRTAAAVAASVGWSAAAAAPGAANNTVADYGEGLEGVVDLVTWLHDIQSCVLLTSPEHSSTLTTAAGGGAAAAAGTAQNHHQQQQQQQEEEHGKQEQQQEQDEVRRDPHALRRLRRVQRVPWLRQAHAQADELSWLLEHNPDNMVCVEELLQQALLHPMKQRVSVGKNLALLSW